MFLVRRVSYRLVFTLFWPAGLPWTNEADLPHSHLLVSTGPGALDLFFLEPILM